MSDQSKTAASGRFDILRHPEPGAGSWIHRWMGEGFRHRRGDDASACLCQPYWIAPDDPRSMDEIADDIEDIEGNLS